MHKLITHVHAPESSRIFTSKCYPSMAQLSSNSATALSSFCLKALITYTKPQHLMGYRATTICLLSTFKQKKGPANKE